MRLTSLAAGEGRDRSPEHPVVAFDREGHYLHSWGAGQLAFPTPSALTRATTSQSGLQPHGRSLDRLHLAAMEEPRVTASDDE